MGPDEICESYAKNSNKKKITIRIDQKEDMVVIEGEADALKFIGNLLLAQAEFKKDCSFFIGPKGAGMALFDKNKSTHGLYINRLSC